MCTYEKKKSVISIYVYHYLRYIIIIYNLRFDQIYTKKLLIFMMRNRYH